MLEAYGDPMSRIAGKSIQVLRVENGFVVNTTVEEEIPVEEAGFLSAMGKGFAKMMNPPPDEDWKEGEAREEVDIPDLPNTRKVHRAASFICSTLEEVFDLIKTRFK